MREYIHNRRAIVFVVALLLGAAVSFAWGQQTSKKADMIEYWLVEVNLSGSTVASRAIQERLNKLGAGGWELVEVSQPAPNASVVWLYMKREG